MRLIDLRVAFTEFDTIEELPAEDQELILQARKSMSLAYAPYSHFQVGAALRLENNVIVAGNNQENASYPEGLCAERVALFAAGAMHAGIKIKTLAVVASSENHKIDKPVTPCGACRQVIAEYEHRYKQPIRLIMMGESGKILSADSISQLLPYLFNGDDLKAK
jgi:cytidine deaminase